MKVQQTAQVIVLQNNYNFFYRISQYNVVVFIYLYECMYVKILNLTNICISGYGLYMYVHVELEEGKREWNENGDDEAWNECIYVFNTILDVSTAFQTTSLIDNKHTKLMFYLFWHHLTCIYIFMWFHFQWHFIKF